MRDLWVVDRATYSLADAGGRVELRRNGRALGSFDDAAAFERWSAGLDERPPVPGAASPFPNDYIHRVAWKVCLARKRAAMERGLRRVYEPAERDELLGDYLSSGMTRAEFAAARGVPAGTLGRWAHEARRASAGGGQP